MPCRRRRRRPSVGCCDGGSGGAAAFAATLSRNDPSSNRHKPIRIQAQASILSYCSLNVVSLALVLSLHWPFGLVGGSDQLCDSECCGRNQLAPVLEASQGASSYHSLYIALVERRACAAARLASNWVAICSCAR